MLLSSLPDALLAACHPSPFFLQELLTGTPHYVVSISTIDVTVIEIKALRTRFLSA